ncbi:MAG: hypothetical protein IKF80_09940 [Erysipelotrichaceae bacterium]|nr:hypothetical protein [Erysipelotrichaceae bacterium]
MKKHPAALVERQLHLFRCSCGKQIRKGNSEIPKFPCPDCMKKEWEYIGSASYEIHPEEDIKA